MERILARPVPNRNQVPANRISRRRFLIGSAILAAGGGLSLLAACAPQAPSTPPLTPAPAQSPAQPTQSARPSGPIELNFWYQAQGPTFVPVIREMASAFESEHPNIKVKLEEYPTLDMRQKLQPIFTTGGPGPDLVHEGAVVSLSYAHMPYGFIDITDRVSAAGLKSKIPAGAWAPMEEKGRQFGIPMAAFVYMLVRNQDIYDTAGITKVPETWDELLEVTRKVTNQQKGTFGFLTQTDRFISWPLEILWYDSGVGYFEGSEDFISYDTSKPFTFNNPKGVAALKYLRSLAENAPGGIQGNINQTSPSVTSAVAKGNIAHQYTHTIQINQIPGQNPNLVGGKNLKVDVFPKGPAKQGVMFSTSVIGIAKGSKNQDAAWELVRFLSDKWEGKLATSIGNIPVRQDAEMPSNLPNAWLLEPARKALAHPNAIPQAFFPQLDQVRIPLSKNVQAYFLDQMTAEQALDETAKQAQASLAS